MSETSTSSALLKLCLHDLAEGERQLAERMGAIVGAIDDTELRDAFDAITKKADDWAGRLDDAMEEIDAPEPEADNIWMRGILDDAGRDTETIAEGPLRDTALIGAIRKALAAAVVSYETAVAVARAEEREAMAGSIAEIRDERERADGRLAGLLGDIAAKTD